MDGDKAAPRAVRFTLFLAGLGISPPVDGRDFRGGLLGVLEDHRMLLG